MKKLFLLTFFLFGTLVFAQMAEPKITAENPSFDFGDIIEGTQVEHIFIVQNTGEKQLEIDRVRASCGCTAAEPEKKLLAPGEKTKIKVSFNSSGRKGTQRKYVYVSSNDPKTPELRLNFTTNVLPKEFVVDGEVKLPELKLVQSKVDFGDVVEGDIVDTEIELINNGEFDLKISDVKTSCGCTAALLSSEKLSPGEKGTLKIELDTNDRVGKMTRTITLFTNDPKNSRAVITVFANISERKS
ncbi:MAG: DUF1573 domain-containing protein [Melioribacteraceae bacterium]|nr:DUF1573 domain-containing protein [Melioribacteraceae bacterium]MCF8263634.1 DUF1573 domain-containing protein [Melioribacteraceae bacterium]MCF8412059.1 DUF1573 domain-containing protein [Melioribacteraceae bacterium]MCF8431888.1 DUF1573 domain-containing protein [Melioribacteraceae bacterium]